MSIYSPLRKKKNQEEEKLAGITSDKIEKSIEKKINSFSISYQRKKINKEKWQAS